MKISYQIVAVLLALVLTLSFELARTRQQLRASRTDTSLVTALRDSVRYSRDAQGRVVAEKRAIEADFTTVQAHAAELSGNQRGLLHDVASLPRAQRKTVSSATSIQQVVRIQAIDSLPTKAPGPGRTWVRKSDTLSYRISAFGDSVLRIEKLEIPNRLSLITYRGVQQELHVQVTNSNSIFRTQDVDAIVPEKPKKRGIILKILALLGATVLGYAAH